MAVDWAELRARFPVTERCIYMNTGWSGPQSHAVLAAFQERATREAFDGPQVLEVRNEKARLVREARAALARLIGADAADTALTYTTTDGINAALWGAGVGRGDTVVTTNLEHPSVIVPCYELGRRTGANVTVVRSTAREDAGELAERFREAIVPATKLVVLSHISYNRGTRLPLEPIIERAHDVGALVLIDGAQSAGQIPVDVQGLGADFYALPSHKYVLGPTGAGALYVRRGIVDRIEPPAVTHGASEYYDFEGTFRPNTSTTKKFEMATHSGPALAGAIEAVALLESIGLENVEHRLLHLATRLIEGLQRIPHVSVKSPLDPALRSALVTFAIDGQDPNETCAALWTVRRIAGRVANDRRVRLSLAIFNNEEDVDAALETVEELALKGLPPGSMPAARYKELLAEDED